MPVDNSVAVPFPVFLNTPGPLVSPSFFDFDSTNGAAISSRTATLFSAVSLSSFATTP